PPPVRPPLPTRRPSDPAGPLLGTTYHVAAIGGRSGKPVTFAIDPSAGSVCTYSGGTVTFTAPGTCVIDANQDGNTDYLPVQQAQHAGQHGTHPLIAQPL